MKMKQAYYLTALFLLLSAAAFSQASYLGGSYSISIPLDGIEDYISKSSFRGANFEGLKEINARAAVGWILGWNVFAEKRVNEVYTDDNLTLTGTQYRYRNLFPILARGLYEFGQTDASRPFIGAGMGVTADISRTNIGLYSFEKTGWHFTVAPELGIKIPLGYGSITTSLRYTYGVKTKELESISYFSLNLGMLWGEK
jgi:hypothetical protein